MKLGKLGCIVQARTTSSRLPGKVLKTLDFKTGKSILQQVIQRLKRIKAIDEIIIATTTNNTDDSIVVIAQKEQVSVFRGSEQDVLDRYFQASEKFGLDTVIRITSDCPFIDPFVIEELISFYERAEFDYISNGQHRTYPHGLDCEIFSFESLKKAYIKSTDSFYREHVTSYIYSHPEQFKVGSLELVDEDYSDLRITVDTEQDYVLACLLQDYLSYDENFSFREIVKIFDEKPFLSLVNKNIMQKKQYPTKQEELEAALQILQLQELKNAADIIKRELDKEKE